jgi:hypothetical protein
MLVSKSSPLYMNGALLVTCLMSKCNTVKCMGSLVAGRDIFSVDFLDEGGRDCVGWNIVIHILSNDQLVKFWNWNFQSIEQEAYFVTYFRFVIVAIRCEIWKYSGKAMNTEIIMVIFVNFANLSSEIAISIVQN